jgi:phosphatidate phosphatase APP1
MLVTNATSILKMMRLTLLSSSRSRVAFSAAAVLYRALQKTHSPFFYVSSSPWNLYEFLSDFMHLHNFPTGPMLLRDFGLDRDMLVAGPHDEHKIGEIRRVLDTVHDLPFILIGDSGQDDTQIYAHIAESYPGRILACYIRDVTDAVVNTLAHRFEAAGVPFLRAADTLEVAKDAQSRGWLEAADVEQVRLSIAATAPMPAEA